MNIERELQYLIQLLRLFVDVTFVTIEIKRTCIRNCLVGFMCKVNIIIHEQYFSLNIGILNLSEKVSMIACKLNSIGKLFWEGI